MCICNIGQERGRRQRVCVSTKGDGVVCFMGKLKGPLKGER